MLKRNLDESQVKPRESRREGEPQAKLPDYASQVVDNCTSKTSQIEIPRSNVRDAVKSSPMLAALLAHKAPVDKNKFFDNVLDYFDKVPGLDRAGPSKPSIANTEPVIIDLDSDDSPPPKSEADPSEAQLPQMIRNPKALLKTANMLRNPPEIIPISGQKFTCSVLTGDSGSQVYQSVDSSPPDSPGPNETSSRFGDIIPKADEFRFLPIKFSQPEQPECCFIEKIIKRFHPLKITPLSESEILTYINAGRPTPAIPSLGVSVTLYDNHTWITGCPTLERLYCWICILFTVRLLKSHSTVWLREGFKAMNMLGAMMTRHTLSRVHKEAVSIKYQLVKKRLIPNPLPSTDQDTADTNPPAQPDKNTTSEPSDIQNLPHEGITKPASLDSRTVLNPENPVRTPPLDSSISRCITPNNLNQDRPAVSRATRSRDHLGAFLSPTPQLEVCDLTQCDDYETSPGTVELSRPSDYLKERLSTHAQNLELTKKLKTRELTPSEPPAKNQTPPPQTPSLTPTAPKTHPLPKFDLANLLIKYFQNGTFNGSEKQREEIIALGRPTPDILGLAQRTDVEVIYFNMSYYDEYPWMCGSAEMSKLYCWPCLVFSDHHNTNAWNTVGYSNLANLPSAAKGHSINQAHLELSIRLKMIEGSLKNKSHLSKTVLEKHNEIVRQKRSLLKYLIDAVCFKKKLLNNAAVCHEDFSEFLKILSSYDSKLKTLLDPESANYMADFTPNFISNYSRETVKALKMFLKRKIAQEVEYSVYVSFILKTVKNNRVALILRYTESTGDVYERFYKFIKIGFGLREVLLKKIVAEVNELKCSAKFVGISYDGGVLRPDQMESFNSNLRKEFMAAYFFHYRDENFKSLLQQSLSHTPVCRSFFQLVTEFGKFLQDNPRVANFIRRMESEVPNEKPKEWDLESGIIITIRDNYLAIMKFLDLVVKRSLAPQAWNNHVISQCEKFSMFLGLGETRLLVVLFSKVFMALHPVIEAFQGMFDAKYWKGATADAYSVIVGIRVSSFGVIYKEAEEMLGLGFNNPSSSLKDRLRLSAMFTETIEWVLAFLKYRTKYIDIWAYFDASTNKIDSPVAKAHQNQAQFLMDLRECFPFFDYQKLGSALTFAHNHARFRNKSPAEIIRDMIEWDLKSVLPELYSFLLLIQTVPQSSAHVSSPVSGKIASYVEGKMLLKSSDALLHLEKDLLSSARSEANFYNDVLNIIAELKQSDEFTEIPEESCI